MTNMIKLTFIFMTLTSFNLFASEVPKELESFLDGKSEKIYKGETKSGYGCEFRFSKTNYGFFIEAYERNAQGQIEQDFDYGRFVLDTSHELYEYFYSPSYGIEAESRYFSSAGVSFDTRVFFEADMNGGKLHSLYLKYQKNNTFFFFTKYKLKCIIN